MAYRGLPFLVLTPGLSGTFGYVLQGVVDHIQQLLAGDEVVGYFGRLADIAPRCTVQDKALHHQTAFATMRHLIRFAKYLAVNHLLIFHTVRILESSLVLPMVAYVIMGSEGLTDIGPRASKRAAPIVFHQLQPLVHAPFPWTGIRSMIVYRQGKEPWDLAGINRCVRVRALSFGAWAFAQGVGGTNHG